MSSSSKDPTNNVVPSICIHHDGKDIVYVCEDCTGKAKLACSDCVISIHRGHSMDLLSRIVSQKKERIRKLIAAAEENNLTSQQTSGDAVASQEKQNYETIENIKLEIERNAEEMKQEIDLCTNEKMSLCDSFGKENAEKLLNYKSELISRKERFQSHIDECKRIIEREIDVELFLLEDNISIPVDPAIPVLMYPTFLKCDSVKPKIMEACGKLITNMRLEATCNTSHDGESLSTAPTQVNEEMSTNDRAVTLLSNITCPEIPRYICATSDGSIWICSQDKMSAIKIDPKGEVLHTFNCYVEITGMSLSSLTNHIWVSGQDCSIREIFMPQPIVVRFYVEEVPSAVCLTSDENVLVGLPNVVKMYTVCGKHLRSTSVGGFFKSQTVIFPTKIVECPITHDIAIISQQDISSRDKIVVKVNSKLKNIVGFSFSFSPKEMFEPIDLCFLNRAIVVLNKATYAFYISSDGSSAKALVKFKAKPIGIAHQDNFTWVIGFTNKSVKVLKCTFNLEE